MWSSGGYSYRDPFAGLNQQLRGGSGGQGGSGYRSDLYANNPTNIMQGDAFQRLLQLSRQGHGLQQAQQTMQPAIDYATQGLQNPNPLGQGRGDLVRQQGYSAARTAGDTARRRIGEASHAMGRSANAEAAAFSQQMTRIPEAGVMADSNRQAQEVALQERQANEQFRAGLAQSLSSMGLGLGGLGVQEGSLQTQAAAAAGQLESFARNSWADILASLLRQGSGGGGSLSGFSLEDRGILRDLAASNAIGHLNDFSSSFSPFGAYGSFGGVYSERY